MVDILGAWIAARDLPEQSLLSREQVAAALSELGFKMSVATLASKASRGSGPRYVKFNGRTLYCWADVECGSRLGSSLVSLRPPS
jgi:hypothetical protein